MTLSTFLLSYLLGGLTFIPLLLAAVFVPAWRILPEVEENNKEHGDDDKNRTGEEKHGIHSSGVENKEEAAASGIFAVQRKYDFPAAIAALNARNNTVGGAGNLDGTGEVSSMSESVYQSMYRSVFDRSKNVPANTSIMASESPSSGTANVKVRKGTTPVNIFYIVLRHGHLMLYDSIAQIEVRHVISLAHHNISVSSGEGYEEAELKDGDFFIKRTAIVLTPVSTDDFPNGATGGHLQSSVPKKPFYLFSSTCIEKEDFYHALLSTRTSPPVPNPLDTDGIIKLQSTLHSTNSLTPETRGINAIISRLFLALHHTDRLKSTIRNKIEKKISRVQKPAFIAALAVHSIDLGDSAPIIINPRLKDLNISGDMIVGFDVRYMGGVKVTVSALAKLDLGPRFKTRTADLLLSTSLTRLQGHVLVRIKPPPSNRIWFCFDGVPEMEIKVEPVVQSRQITYTFILRAIEEKIRSVVTETLVKPNWDDISFFDTRGQSARGGIWLSKEESEDEKQAGEALKEDNEKTRSMPSLIPSVGVDGDSSAASSGSEAPSRLTPAASIAVSEANNELKRRSIASLPAERESKTPSPLPQKPPRSPSLASPPASVASVQLDQSSAKFDPVRSDPQSQVAQQKRWRMRPAPPQQVAKKDAIETMREMRDRSIHDRETYDDHDGLAASEPSEIEDSELFSTDRSLRQPKRTNTNASTVTSSSSTSTRNQRQQEAVQKGKNLLAATAAATSAARTWSWNAIQNRSKASRAAPGQAQQEPLGRGQPLPPPGVPLPGPQKGWLPSGVGVSGVKRKPVPPLPARKGLVETQSSDEHTAEHDTVEVAKNEDHEHHDGEDVDQAAVIASPTSDDFGPWRENSGAGLEEVDDDIKTEPPHAETSGDGKSETETEDAIDLIEPGLASESSLTDQQNEVVESLAVHKVPPPLPARPPTRLNPPDEGHMENNETHGPLGRIRKGSNPETTSSTRMPVLIRDEELKDHYSDSEADSQHINTDADELIAIPAPFQEDAEEIEFDTEEAREVQHTDTSTRYNAQLEEHLQAAVVDRSSDAFGGITSQITGD